MTRSSLDGEAAAEGHCGVSTLQIRGPLQDAGLAGCLATVMSGYGYLCVWAY